MSQYFYFYEINGGDFHGELMPFESAHDSEDGSWLAEDAAEWFFDHDGGWEADWPCKIAIYGQDKHLIGSFNVEMGSKPEFHVM